jgi:hypothetical protein
MKKIIVLSFLVCCTAFQMLHAADDFYSFPYENEVSNYEGVVSDSEPFFDTPLMNDLGGPCPNCFGGVLDANGECNQCDFVRDGNHGTGTETPGAPVSNVSWGLILLSAITYGLIISRRKLPKQD